jgi:pimeloyl-ACP methyl ester carboxylesterase
VAAWQAGGVLAQRRVRVSAEPVVELFVAASAGPAARTLLVVHGGPDWDHSYLREPLVELAGSYRLLLPDLRGCGRSTRGLPDGQYTPDAVVADLVALLDAFGAARADVLGFSYGGLIAQRLALAHPDRVRRLILASTSLAPVPPAAFAGWGERDHRRAAETALWARTSLTGADLTRAAAFAGAPANVWRSEALPDYLRRLHAIRFSGDWLRVWQAGTLPPARPDHAVIRLAALRIPTLLLHGRQDMTFPAVLTEQAAAQIPTAEAVILDTAGHMTHLDQPRPWLAAITDHLNPA